MKPEQIRHVYRKIRHILFGGVLRFLPPFMLLVVGLTAGLLPAIPVYLMVRFACVAGHLNRKGKTLSWKQWPDLSALLLGGTSLVTQNPIWFQLEVPIVFVLGLTRWVLFRKSPLDEVSPPFEASVIGEVPRRLMKTLFIASLIIIPAINLWLTLYASESSWLLFRSMAFPVWASAMGILVTWFAHRKAERDA